MAPRLRSIWPHAGATFVDATPTTWQLLLAAGWTGQKDLTLISTGEALPRPLADRLLPGAKRLWNLYGPTEATIWATGDEVQPGEHSVPIGTPLPGRGIMILDGDGKPVEEGELRLSGGIAQGYVGNREAFPCVERDGARWYATGDRVRRRTDGRLEYLGRLDVQLKLRGHRIQPGEIENVLRSHPSVLDAIVQLRPDPAGDDRLVAYVVTQSQSVDDLSRLNEWQCVYDAEYADTQPSEPAFNTAGWRSSFTGRPFSRSEMENWLSGTVERLRPHARGRVLELGCGTGLCLFQLAGESSEWHATDISPAAIGKVAVEVAARVGHTSFATAVMPTT